MPIELLHRDDLEPHEIEELEAFVGPFSCGGDVEEQLPIDTVVDIGIIEGQLRAYWRKGVCSSCQADVPFELPLPPDGDLMGWELIFLEKSDFGLVLCPDCQTNQCHHALAGSCVQLQLPPSSPDSSD